MTPQRPQPRARVPAGYDAKLARAAALVEAGASISGAARDVGIDRKSLGLHLERARAQASLAAESSVTSLAVGQVAAVEAGRSQLVASIGQAVSTVVESMRFDGDRDAASSQRVRLHAAFGLLDRVGLHPKAEVNVTSTDVPADVSQIDALIERLSSLARLERERAERNVIDATAEGS